MDPDISELERELRAIFRVRQPRYRYFQSGQHMFCWTTEKLPDGKYRSWVYAPVGAGSRTGKAQEWRARQKVKHAKRKDAKARATRLWAKNVKGTK